MAGVEFKTDIHLVSDLKTALGVASGLGASAVALDVEGVLGNYVGNEPYDHMLNDFLYGDGKVNMHLAIEAIRSNPNIAFGLATNNTNTPNPYAQGAGLVSMAAEMLRYVPFVHKGMEIGGVALGAKPSGEQAKKLCEIVGVAPKETVLIDDQGVKNAGEAVKAGLKAIIVPNPIGLHNGEGGVKEHKGVEFLRRFEPRIFGSLAHQGVLAKLAYSRIAGVGIDRIGELHDHRS